VSVPISEAKPAGVRAVTGERQGRLSWVSAEALATDDAHVLARGSRVVVREGDSEWLGEVVVPPGQVRESSLLAGPPYIVRFVTEADAWPGVPDRAGRALLESLRLAPDLFEPSDS
jgi:hypothetical protein